MPADGAPAMTDATKPCPHARRVIRTVSPHSVAAACPGATCATWPAFTPYDVADCEDCGAKNVGMNFTVHAGSPAFSFRRVEVPNYE